jgi:hypothetical protein
MRKPKKQHTLNIDPLRIHSKWFGNLLSDWKPDRDFIDYLKRCLERGKSLPPVVIVQEEEKYFIVNGHHRLFAHLEMGANSIKCILIAGTFQESEPLRKAENLLKEYDTKTEYRYQFSGYLDRWAAAQEGHEFINKYRPTASFRLLRWIKARFSKGNPNTKDRN